MNSRLGVKTKAHMCKYLGTYIVEQYVGVYRAHVIIRLYTVYVGSM